MTDPTLTHCRTIATIGEKGYVLMNGLLFKNVKDDIRKKCVIGCPVHAVIRYCKSCPICAKCNKAGQKKAPLQKRPILTEAFEPMACNINGPFQKIKKGYRYVLTAICLATRWPVAIPMKNIKSHTVAQALMEVFSQTSIPLDLLTDPGAQFTEKLFKEIVAILNNDNLRTAAYYPQINGAVERLNGTIK